MALPPDIPPAPGDVISDGDHVGIFDPLPGGVPRTTSAAAPMSSWAAGLSGAVVNNDWGFRTGQDTTTRRFEGDLQRAFTSSETHSGNIK